VSMFVDSAFVVSGVISTVMLLFAIVAFILAALGKLTPRLPFLLLSGFYFVQVLFGGVTTMALMSKVNPDELMQHHFDGHFVEQQLAWYRPALMATVVVWLVLSVYGLMSYAKSQGGVRGGSQTG